MWDIMCDFKDELEVNQNGNHITISIDCDDCIDEMFKLSLCDKDDISCNTSMVIKIDSLL